ncbi:Aldo/keto reductase [Artomyces pyxidatus]|uniref:Aldo/keto reductase n=1 Tax=Artomyces pyxidatus TaxID=48021 RepID=A0ACB8TI51_9AGAM|nr:Aldo/keto reductase [Artomyces pyxidatus]
MSIVLKRTGQKMPLVGMGTWKLPNAECADNIYHAIKVGVRLIDAASDYGNEKEVAEGIQRALKEGIVKREDIFITSKVWNTNHAHDHVKEAVKYQLAQWGLDYFDLYLVHFPIALKYVDPAHRYPAGWFGDDGKTVELQNTPFQETWQAMEELVDEGLVKNIGVSNVAGTLLLDILRYARIPPQVLQVELHPYLTQQALVNLAKQLDIPITAYSSLGPQGYFEMGFKGTVSLLQHDLIVNTAKAHGKTPGQVILRWSTQRGIAVIPKTSVDTLTIENQACNSFDLTEEEINAISGLNINLRLNDPVELDPRLGIFA